MSAGDWPHVLDRDLPDAAGAPVGGRAARTRQLLQVAGIVFQVPGGLAVAVAAKPRHAVGDVSGVADLAHLAVADDVDPGVPLARDDGVHGVAEDVAGVLDRFAPFPGEDRVRNEF